MVTTIRDGSRFVNGLLCRRADKHLIPFGMAIDASGSFWVADAGSDRFQIFAPDATFLETWERSGAENGELSFATTRADPAPVTLLELARLYQ